MSNYWYEVYEPHEEKNIDTTHAFARTESMAQQIARYYCFSKVRKVQQTSTWAWEVKQ